MDFTGNGRLDILTGSIGGQVSLFRRRPNGTYAAGETLRFASASPLEVGRSSSVAVAHWNGNDKFSLLVGNGAGAVFVIPNVGTRAKPVFGQPEQLRAGGRLIEASGGAAAPYVADWDGDGLPDLILGSASGEVVWCRNIGTKDKPELAAPVTLIEPVPRQGSGYDVSDPPTRSGPYAKVCVTDWNGDGRADLVVGDYVYRPPGQPHGWVWIYLHAPVATASAAK